MMMRQLTKKISESTGVLANIEGGSVSMMKRICKQLKQVLKGTASL
jgi:hypothetical protein